MNRISASIFGVFVAMLAASSVASSVAHASDAAPYPETRVTEREWRTFREKVRKISDIECREDKESQLICDSSAMYTIWVFTTPGHPAHPAVSRGRMVVTDAYIAIDRHGYYAGSEDAFRRWHQEFKALDQRQVKEWEGMIDRSSGSKSGESSQKR